MNRTISTANFKNKYLLKHSLFFAAFIPVAFLIIWKCRYGFANLDEAFYMTIPYRLLQGDALFVNEWHPSQMTAFILYPFAAIYTKLNGSFDGVILMSRYACAVLFVLGGLLIYFRLSRYSWIGAAVSALSFTLFLPYNIMALCYNSLGIILLSSSLVIFFSARSHLPIQYYLVGVLFALAVLCNPYLALAYLFYALIVFFINFLKRAGSTDVLSYKTLLFVTLGAASMAILFLTFVLSRSSLAEIIKSIPMMFTDPEHGSVGFARRLYIFLFNPIIQNSKSIVPHYFILYFLLLVCFFDKKRYSRKLLYFIPALLLTFYIMLSNAKINYINQLMWAINLAAPFVLILSEKPVVHRLFAMLWIPGMFYSFCMHMASNQIFFAISAGSSVAVTGSIMMLCIFFAEIKDGLYSNFLKSCVCLIIVFMLLFQILSVAHLRYTHIYWDTVISDQHILMEEGFNKGIYVSDRKYKLYHELKSNLAVLNNYETENILFLSEQTWYYLESPLRSSSYCSILSGINENTISRLQQYYLLCPDKLPDVVFVEKTSSENCVYPDADYIAVANKFCQTFNYNADEYKNCLVLTPAVN